MYVCKCVCTYVCVCVCTYVCVYVCVHLLACMQWITESPYFLLNIRGDRKKAYAVLKNISDLNHRPLPAGELVSEDEQRLGMM